MDDTIQYSNIFISTLTLLSLEDILFSRFFSLENMSFSRLFFLDKNPLSMPRIHAECNSI